MQTIEVIATENYFFTYLYIFQHTLSSQFLKQKKYKGGGYGEGACPSPLHLKTTEKTCFDED